MKKTLQLTALLLMAVQVGFGIIYMVKGIGAGQQYPESIAFLSLCPVPAFLYVFLQILVGICALWFFFGVVFPSMKHGLRAFLCAYFLTVPFILQMQISVLPYGFCLSALLWLLGEQILLFRDETIEKKRVCRVAVAFFLLGLFCTDGPWPGLLLLVILALFLKKRAGKLRYTAAIIGVALLLLLTEAIPFVQDVRKLDTNRNSSFGTAMISRFMWPDVVDDYWALPLEIKYAGDISVGDAALWRIREREIERTFYPRLVDKYGYQQTEKMLLETAARDFGARKKERIENIWDDIKSISILPFTLEQNLNGKGDSVTGRNYSKFVEAAPETAGNYLRYSFFVLPILLLFCLLAFLSERMAMASETWGVLLFSAVAAVVWFAVRSNAPLDYKPMVFLLFMWHLPIAILFRNKEV